MDSAINGLLQSLDPYSSYMSPETFELMQTETSGEFGGLGIEVTMENDVVWEHDFGNNNIFIARGQKYPMDYLGGGFPDYTLGDVDFNGEIGILDILYIADMALGIGYGSSPAADINEDGNITISDRVHHNKIINFIFLLRNCFVL